MRRSPAVTPSPLHIQKQYPHLKEMVDIVNEMYDIGLWHFIRGRKLLKAWNLAQAAHKAQLQEEAARNLKLF